MQTNVIYLINGQAAGVTATKDPLVSAQLKLNGHDRTSSRHITHYTRQQIYDYHTGYGSTNGGNDRIAVYSFALEPEEHQPSGTCNFSRIDSAVLLQGSSTTQLDIFAINESLDDHVKVISSLSLSLDKELSKEKHAVPSLAIPS